MEGITVLSETISNDDKLLCVMVIIGLCGAFLIICLIWCLIKKEPLSLSDYITLSLLLIICILIEIFGWKTYVNSEYIEQKVIIADPVSINDFNKHYEVLNIEGSIYTVKVLD